MMKSTDARRPSFRYARLLAAAGVLSGITLVYACSDDDRPAAAGAESTSGQTPTPPPTSVSPRDSSTPITARPDLCDGLVNDATAIAELEHPADPPEALGGEIQPGVYDLTELTAYAGETKVDPDASEEEVPRVRSTGRLAQATLVVTKFEMRFVEARGTVEADAATLPASTRAVLYRTENTSLLGTAVCPSTAEPVALPYSAVGGSLAIFVDDKHRELYVRR